MWPRNLRSSLSIGRRVMPFVIFSQLCSRPPCWISKILILNHVTVIVVLTFLFIPNYVELGLCVRAADAHYCRMFNASLVGSGLCHGNRIMGTCRAHAGICSTKLRPSRSIGRQVMAFPVYFQHAGRMRLWICNILIFDVIRVIAVVSCCCIANFIEIGSRFRPAHVHKCRMFNVPLLGNGCCHSNRIVVKLSVTWCYVSRQLGYQLVHC